MTERLKRCKHKRTYRRWRWYGRWISWSAAVGQRLPWEAFDLRVCADCGSWLSLGPSNDTPPEVQQEIRAADIAATLRDTNVPRFTECEAHGWEAHANDIAACPILCEPPEDFHAAYLARCIVTHDGGTP
jgi:hypothetical protein